MMTPLPSKWAAGKARGGRISKAIRNRRATPPPAYFQRNPLGRGQLAVFLRCSRDPYPFRYGRFARALKNSQLTCGDVTNYMRDGTLARKNHALALIGTRKVIAQVGLRNVCQRDALAASGIGISVIVKVFVAKQSAFDTV